MELNHFAITKFAPPEIILIDGDEFEEHAYVGEDAGEDSLFHSMGYLLARYGLYDRDAVTLRSLTATAITQLYESGAVNLIDTFLHDHTTHTRLAEYIQAIKIGTQPGDLLCIIAMEFHFGIHVKVYRDRRLASILHPHFCSAPRDTLYLDLAGVFSYAPLDYYELPGLIADNYCLTCGIGVPNPLESICNDCVRRPRFCVSCGLTYVASTEALCIHCAGRMDRILARRSEALGDTDFEDIIQSCGRARSGSPSATTVSPVEEKRPLFCVYLANGPFDDFRSGDGTYMNEIVKWIDGQGTLTLHGKTYDVKAFRVCDTGKAKGRPPEESAVKLIEIPYIEGWPSSQEATEKMTMCDWQEYYEPARQLVYKHLSKIRAEDTHPDSIHIFHAQVRYPDSGALYDKEFLEALKKAKFKVVVTCHEMEFNFLTPKNMQKTVVQLNQFVAAADRTIFLNEYDLMNGVTLMDTPNLFDFVESRCPPENDDMLRDVVVEATWSQGDPINPSGKYEVKIVVPPPVKQCLFHIPGIATVSGAPFGIDDVLKRPENILVFGLIKQKDAMDAASDVAKELMAFPGLKVIVVGKVFKDYQHTAIARLIRRKCHLTSKQESALTTKFDIIGRETKTDSAFYEQLVLAIKEEETTCIQKWDVCRQKVASDFVITVAKVKRAVVETMTWIQEEGEPFDLAPPICEQVVAIKERGELDPVLLGDAANDVVLKQRIEDAEEGYQALLVELRRLEKALQLNTEATPATDRVTRSCNTVANAIDKDLRLLKEHMTRSKWNSAMLPIEIHFDASPEELQGLATQCRYAFKVDQKSMADNASSIISLMAQGCIVFTESRFDTPDEYRSGGPSGGLLSPVIMPPNHLGTCDGAFVVNQIARRRDDLLLNIQTLKNMLTLLTKRYGLASVAKKHLAVYKTLVEKE